MWRRRLIQVTVLILVLPVFVAMFRAPDDSFVDRWSVLIALGLGMGSYQLAVVIDNWLDRRAGRHATLRREC